MVSPDADRAVTPIIGGILLAGLVVFFLAVVQVNGVPTWNKQTEAQHSDTVLGDMQELQASLLAVAADNTQRATTVTLGTSYTNRPPLRNPSDPSGLIRTGDAALLSITGAVATGETRDYWDGTTHEFATTTIEYQPSYNYYDSDSLVTEAGVLYKQFEAGTVAHSEQQLIRGNRISLTLIDGSLSEAGESTTLVSVKPVSAPARAVTVKDSGTPITLTIPTNVPESKWRELLADELTPDGHIANITYQTGSPTNHLIVTLEQGVTYELRLSKVGVGTVDEQTQPHYVIRGDGRFVQSDSESRAKLVVQVRDRYDNPVSNAPVTFDADVGVFEDDQKTSLGRPATVRTDDEGNAIVWLNVTNSLGVHDVRVDINESVDYQSALPRETVDFKVVNTGGGGSGSNSAEAFVVLKSITPSDGGTGSEVNTYQSLTLNLENLGSTDLSVIGFQPRFLLASVSGTLTDGPTKVTKLSLGGETRTIDASENQQPVFFEASPLTLSTGTVNLKLTFDQRYQLKNQNDAFGVSITLYYEGGFSTSFTAWRFKQ